MASEKLSMDKSEIVSRKDEIRALFIFGLLAVFASIRVQYSELQVTLGYGTVNLVPIIDDILMLWSLYAFFMVIGLSGDIVGKTVANMFRDISRFFLQWSYIILAVLMIPIGLIAYGERFLLMSLLIILVVVVGLIIAIGSGKLSIRRGLRSIRSQTQLAKAKRNVNFILGFIFVFSTYEMITYPQTGVAYSQLMVVTFIISAVAASLIMFLNGFNKNEKNEAYTSQDDYFY